MDSKTNHCNDVQRVDGDDQGIHIIANDASTSKQISESPCNVDDNDDMNSPEPSNLCSKNEERQWNLNPELQAIDDYDGSRISEMPASEDSMTIMKRKRSKHRTCLKRKRGSGSAGDSGRFRYRRVGGDDVSRLSSKPAVKSKCGVMNLCGQSTSETDEDGICLHDGIDIDSILEEKGCKLNLSAINVKNLLRYVITNEHVLSMVHNSMEADGVSDTVFEPKLTRSRAKEMMEKQAQVPWPISPMKRSSQSQTKKLVELEFSDSDGSDEEYMPDREFESGDESFLSSYASETQSPLVKPVTLVEPLQPCAIPPETVAEESSKNDTCAQDVLKHDEHFEDTIALRTRSKLPLTDTPLEFIESNFIAPDITTDMYDSECDDEDWGYFLSEFLKPLDPNLNESNDDEMNDPEYNFLEEEDVPDREDLRDDKAVKIPKKEIQELMAELLAVELSKEELNGAEEDGDGHLKASVRDCISKEKHQKAGQDLNDDQPLFDIHRRLQLEEQMRKHVQLLTQVFLLCNDMDNVLAEKKMCQTLLLELLAFGNKSLGIYGGCSAFLAHNLKAAVEVVVNNDEHVEDLPSSKRKSGSLSAAHRKMSTRTMEILTHSEAFIYPKLLPVAGFRNPGVYKQNFIDAEDSLLALGLEQFMGMKRNAKYYSWKQIKDNMLPTKTIKQISNRAKNLKSMKSQENAVKYYYRNKKAPPMTRQIEPFDPTVLKPLILHLKDLPEAIRKEMACKHYKYLQPKQTSQIVLKPNPEEQNPTSPLALKEKDCIKEPVDTENVIILSSIIPVSENISKDLEQISSSDKESAIRLDEGSFMASKPNALSLRLSQEAAKAALLQRPSPLKQVSPIIKKYSPICLKKTGGNMRNQPRRILPKIRIISHSGPRKLIPKAPTPVIKPQKIPEKRPEDQMNTVRSATDVEEPDLHASNIAQGGGSRIGVSQFIGSDADSEIDAFDDEAGDAADNEDDLAALMAASTTINVTPKQRQQLIRRRKKSAPGDDPSVFSLDLLESDPLKDEKATSFARSYLQKAMAVIGENVNLFNEFLQLLHDFRHGDGNVSQLYKNVCSLLKDFPQLCDDFLVFLLPEQAMECGKFMEHLNLTKMQIFLCKTEMHFRKQPHYFQKLLKIFNDLQLQESLTLTQLKESVLPLLRGQTHLAEEFLQLLPDEVPSESQLMDFEEVVLQYDASGSMNDDGYEYVRLPEMEDVYGTKDCICDCHTLSDKPNVKNRLHHCMTCGVKFIDGRIFLQTGKYLKPCRVIYHKPKNSEHPNVDEAIRITDDVKSTIHIRVISPTSSVSSLSPSSSKDSDEENEATCGKKKVSDEEGKKNPFMGALEHISADGLRCNVPAVTVTEDAILTPDITSSAVGTSATPKNFEVLRDVIHQSKIVPGEKNGETSDEHSPETVQSDSDPNSEGLKNGNLSANAKQGADDSEKLLVSWTRDVDRILLQMCQQFNPNKETFARIAAKIKSKTPEEVERRFEELMDMFAENEKQ